MKTIYIFSLLTIIVSQPLLAKKTVGYGSKGHTLEDFNRYFMSPEHQKAMEAYGRHMAQQEGHLESLGALYDEIETEKKLRVQCQKDLEKLRVQFQKDLEEVKTQNLKWLVTIVLTIIAISLFIIFILINKLRNLKKSILIKSKYE